MAADGTSATLTPPVWLQIELLRHLCVDVIRRNRRNALPPIELSLLQEGSLIESNYVTLRHVGSDSS